MSELDSDRIKDDLSQVIHDAEDLLRATAGMAGEKIDEVRKRAEESLRNARVRLFELRGDAVAQAKYAAGSADEYVRANPWVAIGVAAAAGLLVGALLFRRQDD